MRKRILGMLAGLCVLAAVTALQAQVARRVDRPARFWDRPEVRQELGLADDQIERLAERYYESATSMTALRSQIQSRELDLEKMLDSADSDEEAIRAMAREIGGLRAELYQKRVDDRLTLKTILTPEQQQTLRELRVRQTRARRARPDRARRPRAERDNAGREPREERSSRERRPR